MRRFLLLAHRGPTSPDFPLDDLPGSGRMDLVARFVAACFVRSHGIRAEAVADVLLLGPPDPPRAVRFDGTGLRSLNPDERSTAALVRKALAVRPTGTYPQPATPGVTVARAGLAELLGEGPVVVLDEAGEDVTAGPLPEGATFVLGDDRGFGEEERALLAARGATRVSLGPVSLQADQCVVVLHNVLDRRDAARAGTPTS